jgi:HAD superfamily hydrolase (TIGR01549 family)
MMIKTIIFDLDGTLVNLPIDYSIIRKNLQKFLRTNDELKPLIPSIINICKNDKELIKKSLSIICEEEERSFNNLSIIQNSFELLQKLKNKKISIILMTLQCRSIVEKIFIEYNLDQIFSYNITRNEDTDRFSQIKKILNQKKIIPAETLVIGDKLQDVISAEKINCNSILFNPLSKKIKNIPKKTIEIKKLSTIENLIK